MVPKFYNLKLHSLGFSKNLHYFIYNGKYSNTCSRMNAQFQQLYLQLIIPQYFISNKSGIWSLSLIVHSKG